MGLIVPQTIKVRTSGLNCKYYREKGYTFKKCGDFIEVNVLDLHPGSTAKVKVICDICGKEREMWYRTAVKCNEENELITCASNSCRNKKHEDTCVKKYGVKHPMQCKEIQDKAKDTNLERYGVEYAIQCKEIQDKVKDTNLERYGAENPFGSKEIRDKAKDTNLERYGVENPMQCKEIQDKVKDTNLERYGAENPFGSKEIQDKAKDTNLERYGAENPFGSKEIQDKIKNTWQKNYGENITHPMQVENIREKFKQTMLNNYGVEYAMQNEEIQNKVKNTNLERHGAENPMQNEEIKNKVLDSFQFNHTGPSSRAQRYINYILNGTLNKHICGSLADICIEKENIVIEHDGSGHFLKDKMNGNISPTKESLLREKQREDKIINNGYKMIRFIATKDRIPSDEVILNLVNKFKNSDFKVIRINFEEGTIEKDYNEKSHYNFGKLRYITNEDLEQFESKKIINLK